MLQGTDHFSFYPAQVHEYIPQIELSDSYLLHLKHMDVFGRFNTVSKQNRQTENVEHQASVRMRAAIAVLMTQLFARYVRLGKLLCHFVPCSSHL